MALPNNTGHTRSREDWNPSVKCHDLLHEGVYPNKMALRGSVFTWLKQQVCTEILTFLAARMH